MRVSVAILLALASCGPPPTPRVPRTWAGDLSDLRGKLERCGLTPLREATLPEGSSEIRIWAGFGLQPYPVGGHPVEGIVLRKDGDRLSGTHYPRAPTRTEVTPRSGWPAFGRAIEDAGILEFPDASELQGYRIGLDGITYVVEVYRRGEYRNYHYWGPRLQSLPEAERFVRLLDLLRTETGFDS